MQSYSLFKRTPGFQVKAVGRWPLTTSGRFRFPVIPYEIYGGKIDSGTWLCPTILVVPCQYHPTFILTLLVSEGQAGEDWKP
jgi:hypothetical protein